MNNLLEFGTYKFSVQFSERKLKKIKWIENQITFSKFKTRLHPLMSYRISSYNVFLFFSFFAYVLVNSKKNNSRIIKFMLKIISGLSSTSPQLSYETRLNGKVLATESGYQL